MIRTIQLCEECKSNYFLGTSEMAEMCAECSHILSGYPECKHEFDNGSCLKCGWDGSRSKLIAYLLKRHNMTDQELRDELVCLDQMMKEIPRFQEVETLQAYLVPKPTTMVALGCEWRMDEYAETPDGLLDLTVMLNQQVIVKAEIPNSEEEAVEHTTPCLVTEYQERVSSSQCRQLRIALETLEGSKHAILGSKPEYGFTLTASD